MQLQNIKNYIKQCLTLVIRETDDPPFRQQSAKEPVDSDKPVTQTSTQTDQLIASLSRCAGRGSGSARYCYRRKITSQSTSMFWRLPLLTLARGGGSAFDYLGQKFVAESHGKPLRRGLVKKYWGWYRHPEPTLHGWHAPVS
jgi:hypothetical protein